MMRRALLATAILTGTLSGVALVEAVHDYRAGQDIVDAAGRLRQEYAMHQGALEKLKESPGMGELARAVPDLIEQTRDIGQGYRSRALLEGSAGAALAVFSVYKLSGARGERP